MSMGEFEEFVQTMRLDCQFVLTKIEHGHEHFSPYFSISSDTKVFTALGRVCASERGCHFYGYFSPDINSNTPSGVLLFMIQ